MAITKIQSESLNLADTYAFTGTVTGAGGVNTPAFVVYTSGNTVSDNVITKITMNNEILDTDGLFDSTTNYRFTPNVAGKYFFSVSLTSDASAQSIVDGSNCYIYKNGSEITGARQISDFRQNYVVSGAVTASTIVTMNGSTDYVEFYGKVGVTSGTPYFKDQSHAVGYKIIE
tara:strand:- start:26 stop:544 length:519 start_codon:yes stop_codon:yes gene_type:complete